MRRVHERCGTQRFLRRQCTFGEDRALTNLLLEAGYDIVCQRGAVVRATVPVRYSKLCKMFTRCDRRYVPGDRRNHADDRYRDES